MNDMYAVKVAWDYGERRKYALEPGSLRDSREEAQALAEMLNSKRALRPNDYLRGFKALVVVVTD